VSTQTGKRARRTGEQLAAVRMDALPDDLEGGTKEMV
jgi:hypothetical protein